MDLKQKMLDLLEAVGNELDVEKIKLQAPLIAEISRWCEQRPVYLRFEPTGQGIIDKIENSSLSEDDKLKSAWLCMVKGVSDTPTVLILVTAVSLMPVVNHFVNKELLVVEAEQTLAI